MRGSPISSRRIRVWKIALYVKTHAHLKLLTGIILLSVLACDFITRNEQMRRRNLICAGRRTLKTWHSDYFWQLNMLQSCFAPHCAFLCVLRRNPQVATCPDAEQVLTGDERKRYLDNLFDHTAARRGGGWSCTHTHTQLVWRARVKGTDYPVLKLKHSKDCLKGYFLFYSF